MTVTITFQQSAPIEISMVVPGPKGDTGGIGSQGPQGIQGIQGVKGNTGAQGIQGIQGPQGNVGPQGIQGIQGTPGIDGADAFVYVAYASNSSGTGFSLTPTSLLKYRAEIHTITAIANPQASDFTAATWVKYLGEDGLGAGDMSASTYDPTNKAADAFSMGNMAETAANKIMTSAERTKLSGVAVGATAVTVEDTPTTGHTTQAASSNSVATHLANSAAHNATSAATASRIMARDANGRAKVAAPSAADDIARKDTVDAVIANYVRSPGYGTTGGTLTAYTLTPSPVISAYAEGQAFVIIPHVNCGANPTLNVSAKGAISLLKKDGTAYAAGELKANSPYPFRKVGANFISEGEGGGVLKSVQSGVEALNITTATIDITISAVNHDKSLVYVYPRYAANGDDATNCQFTAEFVSDTIIRLTRIGTTSKNSSIIWVVEEYENVKSKQTGDTSNESDITVSSINPNKSKLVVTSRVGTGGSTYWYRGVVGGYIINSTTLAISFNVAYAGGTAHWELLEFN